MFMCCHTLYCVENNNSIANQAWATKLCEIWDPTTFLDTDDITGRTLQFHWRILSGGPYHERNSNILGIHGTVWFQKKNCIHVAKMSQTKKSLPKTRSNSSWFFGVSVDLERVWYRKSSDKPDEACDRIAKKMTQKVEEASHKEISSRRWASRPFTFQSTTQTMTQSLLALFWLATVALAPQCVCLV